MPSSLGHGAPNLTPASEIRERLDSALATSVADETSLSWIESWSRRARSWRSADSARLDRHRSVQVRVLDQGRLGAFRCEASEAGELELALRQALAHSRVAAPITGFGHLPHDTSPLPSTPSLHDPQIATLQPRAARELLAGWCREGERASLSWRELTVVVADARGLRREALATEARLEVACGEGPGAGRAATAGRMLGGLRIGEVFDDARRRHGTGEVAEPPEGAVPIALAAEATVALVEAVRHTALTAESYASGASFLRQLTGSQVFDARFGLRDDGSDEAGLPFPFDLDGTPKRPLWLVEAGIPRTPALGSLHAAVLNLSPTPHAWAEDDARPEHLFLEGGDLDGDELLAAADGGVWVGSLGALEVYDPLRFRARGVARGVRRIRDRALAASLPDSLWEVNVLQALAQIAGIGRDSRTVADGLGLGGVTAPALVLPAAGILAPRV